MCLFSGAFFLFVLTLNLPAEEVIIHPFTVKAYLDFGHLVNGSNSLAADESNKTLEMLSLNRGNVTYIQRASLADESFDVVLGLTGLLWWPFAEENSNPRQRVMRVKPMVPIARAKWMFGDKKAFHGHFQLGTFPYKYNFEAKNLGEYLYRSGTYPGFLFTTEGWLLMNRAGNYSHGAQAQIKHPVGTGFFTHNFALFMEMVYFPVGDFSPGYDFSYKTSYFEIGGGAVFHHYLPIKPSLLSSNSPDNIYVSAPDHPSTPEYDPYEGILRNAPDTLQKEVLGDSAVLLEKSQWTHKGIKLMGRFTLNLNSFLPSGSSPDDLKLFTEVAVLGLENYPIYFTKISDRVPVMFGINLPTFGLLNILSFQMEYYSSPFNNIDDYNERSSPVWAIENIGDYQNATLKRQQALVPGNFDFGNLNGDTTLAGADIIDEADRQLALNAVNEWWINASNNDDDWRWSLYAKKKINKIFNIYVQIASDHFRLMSENFKTSSIPMIETPKEWYYLIRFEYAIK